MDGPAHLDRKHCWVLVGVLLTGLLLLPRHAVGKTIFDFDEKSAALPASRPETGTPATPARQSIPLAAARQKSQKLIEEMFAKELADHHPVARRALAQRLLDEAARNGDVPADQFVLLIGARQAAEEALDLGLCFKAIDMLTGQFGLEPLKLKIESVLRTGIAADTPASTADNCRAAEPLLEQLLADADPDNAARLASILMAPAQTDPALGALVRKQARKADVLKAARATVATDLEKLRTSPDDPAANLAAGQYYCFYAGAWTRGLPMLARALDPKVKALASDELSSRNSGSMSLDIGDRWWELADAQGEVPRATIRQHAAALYQTAIDSASGLRREVIAKRIAETNPPAAASATTRTAAPLAADAGDAPAARARVKAFMTALVANDPAKARSMSIEAPADKGVLELMAQLAAVQDGLADALVKRFGTTVMGGNWVHIALDAVDSARVTFSKDRQLAMVDDFKGRGPMRAFLVRRAGAKWIVDVTDWNYRAVLSSHPAYSAAQIANLKQLMADVAAGKLPSQPAVVEAERKANDDLAKQFASESAQAFHDLTAHGEASLLGQWAIRLRPGNSDPATVKAADTMEGTMTINTHGSSVEGPPQIADRISKVDLLLEHLSGAGAKITLRSTSGRSWTFEPQPALDRIVGTANLNDGQNWVVEGVRIGK